MIGPNDTYSEAEIAEIDQGGPFSAAIDQRLDATSSRLRHRYTFVPTASKDNDYMIDRQASAESFTGIWGINEQDRALQESMPAFPVISMALPTAAGSMREC